MNHSALSVVPILGFMRFSPLALFLLWCSGLLGQPVLQPFDVNPVGYTADVIAAEFIEPTPASDQPQAWDSVSYTHLTLPTNHPV